MTTGEVCDRCNECMSVPYLDESGNCTICLKCYTGHRDSIFEARREEIEK